MDIVLLILISDSKASEETAEEDLSTDDANGRGCEAASGVLSGYADAAAGNG